VTPYAKRGPLDHVQAVLDGQPVLGRLILLPRLDTLTQHQLDARLELLKARHAALIAQGRIKRRGDADRRSTVDPDRVRRHRPTGDVGGVEEGARRREDAACVPPKLPHPRPSGAGRG